MGLQDFNNRSFLYSIANLLSEIGKKIGSYYCEMK